MPVSILPHDLPPMQVNRNLMEDPARLKNQTLIETLRAQDRFGAVRSDPILKEYLNQYPEAKAYIRGSSLRPEDVKDELEFFARDKGIETPNQFSQRYAGFEIMQNPPRVGTYPDPDPASRYKNLEIRQQPSQIEIVGMGRNQNLQETMHTQPITGWSPEAKEKNLIESLRSGIIRRNQQQVDTTRHSAWAKPLDPRTYREELFYTPPKMHMPSTKATAHWGDTPNPTAHTLSDIVELEDGTKAVNLLESQADTQIAAHKAGGWAPSQKEFDQAEAAQQASGGRLYDSESELHYASGIDPIDYSVAPLTSDRYVIRNQKDLPIGYYIPSTGEFQLGEEGMLAFANAQPQLKNWVEASIGHKQAIAARDDLMKKVAYPQRVPLSREGKTKGVKGKAMEWEKFNLKRLLQRAVDTDADGIMIPNSEELVAKYGKGSDGGQEKAYQKFYDKNLPQEWQKYQKQFGTGAPEVREGPDGVKRLFLPINEKLREEIKTRGLPMYGKRGLADVLGEQYV